MRIAQLLEYWQCASSGRPAAVDAGILLRNLVGIWSRTECYHTNPVAQAREVASTDTSKLQCGG